MEAKPRTQQLNVKVSTITLKRLDSLLDYKTICSRSDAVELAVKIATEKQEKESHS